VDWTIIKWPAYLIINGPERTFRTKFRKEHSGYFLAEMIYSKEDADSHIEWARKNYEGLQEELMITLIHGDNLEEIQL